MKTKRRWRPAFAGLITILLASGLWSGATAGDDSPIQEIMEQVQARNRAIGKGLRVPTALEAAGRKRLAADTASLVKLGKEARTLTGPARSHLGISSRGA